MRAMEIMRIWEISQRQVPTLVGALTKRVCNSTWSTSLEMSLASLKRGDRGLSNAAGLVSRDVDHVELQPRFDSAPTAVFSRRCAISEIVLPFRDFHCPGSSFSGFRRT